MSFDLSLISFYPHTDRCGRVRCEPGWSLSPNWGRYLSDYDLWFVWEGRGVMTTSSGKSALFPGVCLWMRPGGRYEAEQDPKARLGVNYIHFSTQKLQEDRMGNERGDLPASAFSPPFEYLVSRQVELVDSLMRRIIQYAGEVGAKAANAALLTALLMELIREYENGPTPNSIAAQAFGTERRHYEMVMRSAARIRESPSEVLSVMQLASEVGYSTDHFSRIFLKVIGLRPQDYLMKARIERACQLLAESDLSIGEIAIKVGFSDIFYFSRLFRRRTGQSPSEFRRSLRIRNISN